MSVDLDENRFRLEEWKEIRESLRYFGNKRFAQLTVFIAATGFMLNALFDQTDQRSLFVVRIIGICLSILFFVMEKRTVEYIDAFVKRGEQIEVELQHIQLIHKRPKKRIVSGTIATYFLYGLVLSFWVVSFRLK